jgi:hypothetical protein
MYSVKLYKINELTKIFQQSKITRLNIFWINNVVLTC